MVMDSRHGLEMTLIGQLNSIVCKWMVVTRLGRCSLVDAWNMVLEFCGNWSRQLNCTVFQLSNTMVSGELYHLSAEQRHADGQCRFGFCLAQGRGVAQDFVRAAEVCCLSAESGEAIGQANLGWCLENGIGRDLSRLAGMYRRSAE
jgi:hypothetical protein